MPLKRVAMEVSNELLTIRVGRLEGHVEAMDARLTRVEDRELSRPLPSSPQWTPRDYMIAGAGVVAVLAALAEKVGWSAVLTGLVKLLAK